MCFFLLWHLVVCVGSVHGVWAAKGLFRQFQSDSGTNLNDKIQISPRKKSSFFTFAPGTKILKRELSRRKLREISRKFAQIIFSPRDVAEKLRENSRRYSANCRGVSPRDFAQILRENSESLKKNVNSLFIYLFYLFFYLFIYFFDLWFYVPVNNYGHVETTLFLGRLPNR